MNLIRETIRPNGPAKLAVWARRVGVVGFLFSLVEGLLSPAAIGVAAVGRQ